MKRKREDGQAMVEFSLVLPILLLLLCGIIDFGWIFSNELIATNTSREAARYAAVHPDDEATAEEMISNIPNITITKPDSVTYSADKVTVTATVEGTIPVLTPFLSAVLGQTFQIQAETVMRVEK